MEQIDRSPATIGTQTNHPTPERQLAAPELTPALEPVGANQAAFQVLARRAGNAHIVVDDLMLRPDAYSRLVDAGAKPILSSLNARRSTGSIVAQWGDDLIYVYAMSTRLRGLLLIASRTAEGARSTWNHVSALLERVDERAAQEITVRFWHADAKSTGVCHSRTLQAPTLEQVLPTLTTSSANALIDLAANGWRRGGIHIWHGPPGCGKTTAIRALSLAWREHLAPEIILDPDSLLASTHYLMQVLRTSDQSQPNSPEDAPKRRLLILEDAGELVGLDARAHAGAGISRLLNLTDGMFGYDEAPIVIITTNEPVAKLHPAMMRPGRCRSLVEFGLLPQEQAQIWLDDNTSEGQRASRAMSIAELASLADESGSVQSTTQRTFGFFN